MHTVPITPAEAKWARQQLGLSQKQACERAEEGDYSFSLSRLKAFEAGYYRPSEEFAKDLLEYFKGEGVDFADFAPPIVKEPNPDAKSVQVARGKRTCFYLSSSLTDEEADQWFEKIESNQERIRELCEESYSANWRGDPDERTQENQHELLNLLALDSLMLRTLIGANPVEPRALGGRKVRTVSDLLADFFQRNLDAKRDGKVKPVRDPDDVEDSGEDEDEEDAA